MARYVKDYSECRYTQALKHVFSADFVDDFDWDYVSPDGLSVRDAWAMATTWSSELVGHVFLSTDESTEDFRVIPDYQYVCVDIGCCGNTHVVMARGSTLVWRGIAACRGFSAREFPGFWKRLFNQLEKKMLRKTTCGRGRGYEESNVSDACTFCETVAFPRFKINVLEDLDINEIDRVVRLFTGLTTSDEDEDTKPVQVQLSTMLAKLERIAQPSALAHAMEMLLEVKINADDEDRTNALIGDINNRSEFHVNMVDVGVHWTRHCSQEHLDQMMTIGSTMETLIPKRMISTDWFARVDNEFCAFLRWALCIDGYACGKGVRELHFNHGDDDTSVPAIFSALPHTRSVQVFHLDTYDHWDHKLDEQDLAWLAYALFHPDTHTSTWRYLELTQMCFRGYNATITPTQVWEMMARGNNLLTALNKSTAVVDGYFTATIRAGSTLYDAPDDADKVVEVLTEAKEFDVCVASTDVSTLDEWVFVVLIGYGEAWVRSSCIDSIVCRPVGRPCLQGLAFSSCSLSREMDLPKFLEVAGDSLEYLDFGELSDSSVRSVMPRLQPHELCPKVKSLRMKLCEKSFADMALPTSLEELYLSLYGTKELDFFSTIDIQDLAHLQALRFDTYGQPLTQDIVEVVVIPTLRSLPRLRHFVWRESSAGSLELDDLVEDKNAYVSYGMHRAITRELLAPVAFGGQDEFAVVSDVAPTDTLVALSSVVTQCGIDMAIGRLDKEIVELVGSFVGRLVRREFWIQGNRHSKYVPGPGWTPPPPSSTTTTTTEDNMFGGGDY